MSRCAGCILAAIAWCLGGDCCLALQPPHTKDHSSTLSPQHISIPQPDCPEEARAFSFYLSNIGRDGPQGSFDCIQQYVSR